MKCFYIFHSFYQNLLCLKIYIYFPFYHFYTILYHIGHHSTKFSTISIYKCKLVSLVFLKVELYCPLDCYLGVFEYHTIIQNYPTLISFALFEKCLLTRLFKIELLSLINIGSSSIILDAWIFVNSIMSESFIKSPALNSGNPC